MLLSSCAKSSKAIEETQGAIKIETTTEESESISKTTLKSKIYNIGKTNKIEMSLSRDDDRKLYFGSSIQSKSIKDATLIYSYLFLGLKDVCEKNDIEFSCDVIAENKAMIQNSDTTYYLDGNKKEYVDAIDFFDFSASNKRSKFLEKECDKISNDFYGYGLDN